MHTLILGMTSSGKSTLAKMLAESLIRKGKTVIVFDPIFDPSFVASDKTDDADELDHLWQSKRSAHIFIDEAGAFFENRLERQDLLTRGRHWGHSVYLLAQRAMQIPMLLRDQCSTLYLFTSSASDGKTHSEEWNHPQLSSCNTLPKLHFFKCTKFGSIQRLKIKSDFTGVENA